MKKQFLFLLLVLNAGLINAQSFAKTYNVSDGRHYHSNDITSASFGGFVTVGYSQDTNYVDPDKGIFLKLDGQGNIMVSKVFGDGSERFYNVIELSNGYAVHGEEEIYMLDFNGNVLWRSEYYLLNGQPGWSRVVDVDVMCESHSGNIIVAEISTGDLYVLEIDRFTGQVIQNSTKQISASGYNNEISDMIKVSSGYALLITKGIGVTGQINQGLFVLKLDQNLQPALWLDLFIIHAGGYKKTYRGALAESPNGELAVISSYNRTDRNDPTKLSRELVVFALRTSDFGQLWENSYTMEGLGLLNPSDAIWDQDGLFVIGRASQTPFVTVKREKLFGVKIDNNGVPMYARSYPDEFLIREYSRAYSPSVDLIAPNNDLIMGSSFMTDSLGGTHEMVAQRTDNLGQNCVSVNHDFHSHTFYYTNFNAQFFEYDFTITAGIASHPGDDHMFNTTDLCTSKKPSSINSNEATEFLFQIAPNPSSGLFDIVANLSGEYLIEIIDLNGKLVHSEKMTSSQTTMDISHLESGCYVLKMSNAHTVETRKIVIE